MAHAWPYQEAERILRRLESREGADRTVMETVVFETGYGPSGLPHIGTFTEVLRTAMIQRAFDELCAQKKDGPLRRSKLICFSDDMDALRKAPENVPQQDMLKANIGRSLSSVPDPFGCCESFAHHNNAELRRFLDDFGFEYEFLSSTHMYRNGAFDETLRNILTNLDAVNDIIKPTLGEERRATYCPFMPIMEDGMVLAEGYLGHDAEAGTVTFEHPEAEVELDFAVTGGECKLQWKVDWAMRWMALGVDYEMAGKDLIDSVTLSSKIVRALGHQPPVNMIYEMFLDEEGRKISKSLGNGLTIEEWLTYGPQESLAFYLYREPKKAKKLYAGLVPRAIDEYWQARERYATQTVEQQQANPVHHVHGGNVPSESLPVTFGLLLNLIGILGEPDEETVFGYVRDNYAAEAGDEVRRLIPYALAYHRDHVAKTLVRRAPTEEEALALAKLAVVLLLNVNETSSAEDIQFHVYEVGKSTGYADDLRGWFKVVYETVFGSSDGPRLGTFIAVYGVKPFAALLNEAAARA